MGKVDTEEGADHTQWGAALAHMQAAERSAGAVSTSYAAQVRLHGTIL